MRANPGVVPTLLHGRRGRCERKGVCPLLAAAHLSANIFPHEDLLGAHFLGVPVVGQRLSQHMSHLSRETARMLLHATSLDQLHS